MPISKAEAVDLFLRINKGDRLTDEERRFLSEVKELDLSFQRISSLEGLSGFTNLRSLNLGKTKINSLEGLSGLTNLQSLYLGGTQVSSLEGLSRLTNLQSLD